MDIQEQRLAAFEAWARTACGMPAGTPLNWGAVWTMDSWAAWNAALDRVVIDLSKHHGGQAIPGSERMFLSDAREAIEAAGLKVKA